MKLNHFTINLPPETPGLANEKVHWTTDAFAITKKNWHMTYVPIYTLILIAFLFQCSQGAKRKAIEIEGNTKITDFFAKQDSRPGRKESQTNKRRAIKCPTCPSEMAEKISHSRENPDRPYQKCNECGTFRWKGSEDYVDRDGDWTFLEERHFPDSRYAEIEATNKDLRWKASEKLLRKIQKARKDGTLEQISEHERSLEKSILKYGHGWL